MDAQIKTHHDKPTVGSLFAGIGGIVYTARYAAGAANAGLFAVSLLSVAQGGDAPRYHQQLDGFRAKERDRVLALTLEEPA